DPVDLAEKEDDEDRDQSFWNTLRGPDSGRRPASGLAGLREWSGPGRSSLIRTRELGMEREESDGTMRSGREDRPLVVAITGASGAPYAVRLVQVLCRAGRTVHLSFSPSGAY